MKNKAIVSTFHCVDNYGAVLQCLALQEKLKEFFEEVEVLDYCPSYLLNEYKAINTYSINSILFSLYSLPSFLKKRKKFKGFRNRYMTVSKRKYKDVSEMSDVDADYIFVGSDQIWNKDITKMYDPVFFGDIPSCENAKVISYAASLGKQQLDAAKETDFFTRLKNVDSISVREDEAVSLIKPYNDDVTLVIDPTLLLDEEYWKKFVRKSDISGKYIFIYNLTKAPELMEMANVLSKATGMPIIEISGRRKGLKKEKHKTLYSASPEEFLSYIANAGYVITDSFHGTAFSLIFKKDFYVVPHKTRGGRMKTLLNNLGCESRLRNKLDEGFVQDKIDYKEVECRLRSLRKQSEDFIIRSIER